MFIYLAHPIDFAPDQTGIDNIVQLMSDTGIDHYRPGGAFTVNGGPMPTLEAIDRINRFALAAADALVAWLPPGVLTLGVPAEIEEALRSGKPTLILTAEVSIGRSVQLANWASRGATVMAWSHSRMEWWAEHIDELLGILTRKPEDSWTLDDEPVSRGTVGECDPMCANHGGCDTKWVAAANQEQVLPVVVGERALLPGRAHDDDAGLDLAILDNEVLAPGERRMLRTGIKAAIPSGWWGLIIGRSSTLVKHNCQVELGVIDAGYRGELMIQLTNRNDRRVAFQRGTRLAQYVLIPAFTGHVAQVTELPDHQRGTNGYGSSGE
jgi:dUTP pyrophosphatase